MATGAFESFEGPDFTFSALSVDNGPLGQQLSAWHDRAVSRGRVPCLYLTARWCPPNRAIEGSLTDPLMQKALRQTELATCDLDAWMDGLTAEGIPAKSIPAFFLLGPGGKVTGAPLTGAAWGENTPANMAPPLESFLDKGRASLAPPAGSPAANNPAPPAATAPASGGSKLLGVLMLVGALLLLVLGAWLKVRSDEQSKRDAQSERIREDVRRSLQQGLQKPAGKPAPR